MAITPWESWPARLALTQPLATASASSSEAPAARRSAALMRVRRSAWTIGMAFPRHGALNRLLVGSHGLKARLRYQSPVNQYRAANSSRGGPSGEDSSRAVAFSTDWPRLFAARSL